MVINMASVVMAYVVMAYTVMADVVMVRLVRSAIAEMVRAAMDDGSSSRRGAAPFLPLLSLPYASLFHSLSSLLFTLERAGPDSIVDAAQREQDGVQQAVAAR